MAKLTVQSFQTQALVPAFSNLIIFGDSLSDPGNLFDLTGFFPLFPYAEGRFSNGDIWVDYLVDQPGLHPAEVQNFALSGAATGRDNNLDPLIGFLTSTGTNLPGVLDQVDSYLGSLGDGLADPDGLYVVWAGANDIFGLLDDPAAMPDFLANQVQNVATAIINLTQRGADTFLVPNLPDLGLTPRTQDQGTSDRATALSQAFNESLAYALTALEQNPLFNINIVPVDLFTLTREVIARPAEFGFTNVTDPLIGQGGLVDPGFFWWDQQHPTTTAHALLADAFQTALTDAGYFGVPVQAACMSTVEAGEYAHTSPSSSWVLPLPVYNLGLSSITSASVPISEPPSPSPDWLAG